MSVKKVYFLFGNKIEDGAEARNKALLYLKGEGNKYNIELLERSLTTEELYHIIREDFKSWSTRTETLVEGYALMHLYQYLTDDNRDVENWDIVKVYRTEAAAKRAFNRKTKGFSPDMLKLYKIEKGFYQYDYNDFA